MKTGRWPQVVYSYFRYVCLVSGNHSQLKALSCVCALGLHPSPKYFCERLRDKFVVGSGKEIME